MHDSMKASNKSSSRLCPLGDVSLPAARSGVSGAASRVSDVAQGLAGSRGGAFSACLCRRAALSSPGGRRPHNLLLRVGGGRPHTRCPALGLQVPCQAGQRSTPRRFRVTLCPDCRHAVLPAGLLLRQVPRLALALLSVVGVPAFPPRPPWAPLVAVGLASQAARLHRSSVALPLGRGLPTRAAARVGLPGPRVAGHPPARWCVPGPGRGISRVLGDREMTVLRALPSARLVGRGVAGAPVWRVSWPLGPPCRTLPEPGGLGPRLGRRFGGARCRRALRWWCRSG